MTESVIVSVQEFDRLLELEKYVKSIVTQVADDLCWRDVYQELSERVGVKLDLRMLPTEQFMANCQRFEASLRTACPYAQDRTTEDLKDLQNVKQLLRDLIQCDRELSASDMLGIYLGDMWYDSEERDEVKESES